MKIYEIGTGYTPIPAQISAATEIVVEELTKAFLKQNIPVEIVDIATEDRAANKLPIREVKVPSCFSRTDVQLGIMHKLKRVAYSVALANELKKILRQVREKVVLHFHNQYNMFFFLKLTPATLRKKAIIAYTNHSGVWRLSWDEIKDTISKRYFQEAECMKCADLVFVLNEETKRNICAHLAVPEKNVVVIGNGVNTDVYKPISPEEKEQVVEKYGFQDHRVILQVGSVYENKGQLRAAEYMLPLMKKYPDLVYAYVGGVVDAEYQESIRQFAKQNQLEDRIRYLGMVSPGKPLNELYNIAQVTVLPSKYEGFSLVSIESCAAGIPVLVDEDGPIKLGFGGIAYNAEKFAEIAEPLLYEDISEFSEKIRGFAEQTYSWNVIAREYAAYMLYADGIGN